MVDNIIKGRFLLKLSKVLIVLVLCGVCALIFARMTTAEDQKSDNPKAALAQASAPVASSQPAQLSASAVNPITQAAVNVGILSCTSRINQVTTYLTGNSQSGAYLFFPRIKPDQSIFSASIEVQSQGATPIYASASFAPLTSGQAGAVYDAVQYVPQSCADAEKNIFKGLKRIGVMRKDIVILDGGAVKIFLMPAGAGCIVIKKEIVQ